MCEVVVHIIWRSTLCFGLQLEATSKCGCRGVTSSTVDGEGKGQPINYAIGSTHSRSILLLFRTQEGKGAPRKMAQWHKRAFPVLFLTIKNCFIR